MKQFRMGHAALAAALLYLAAGCTPIVAPGAASDADASPRVYFVEPADGATVGGALVVKMGAQNFIVEPAGAIKAGAGHLHILVDTPCLNPGTVVPKDDQHIHYGQGQMEAELQLAPGAHTLCLQAADGAHTTLPGDGMAQIINVTVE